MSRTKRIVFSLCLGLTAIGLSRASSPVLFDGGTATESATPKPNGVLRERTSRVHAQALLHAADTDSAVVFNFFDDVAIPIRFDRLERRGTDRFTWFGTVEGDSLGKALVVGSPRGLTGHVWIPGGKDYEFRAAGSGLHILRERSARAYAPERCEGTFTPADPGALGAPVSNLAPTATCGPALLTDVLVVWTQEAEDDDPNIEDTIQAAVDDANASYANSGIDLRLRLVHAEKISYTESGDVETDRNRLRDTGDGYMDGVHAIRDTYGADLVSLFVSSDPDYCGIAFIQESVGAAFASSAFNVVVGSCAVGNHSFAHECGHNQGARHDRYVDDTDGSPFDYNHGYIYKAGKWRTVMAYNDDCEDDGFDCTRLQYWSNPDLTYNSVALGIAEGNDDAADNRKTLNNTDTTVEAFRARKAPWAEAGGDLSRECNDPDGLEITDVTLDGNGSCDPNGDALTFSWSGAFSGSPASGATPTIGFPLGKTDVTLVVSDGIIASLADTMSVTVADTTDPIGGITYPADGACTGATVVIQDDFTDACDGTLGRTYSPGNGTYSASGDYTVTLTVRDNSLNTASDTVSFVVDKNPPTVTVYPAPPPPVKVDKNGTYPLANGFASGDADVSSGGVVREEILIDGCVVLDGNVFGDGDGLLNDESLAYNKPLLCAAYAACGKTKWVNPKLSVRVTDCGGNTATGTVTAQGSWVISPPNCP